MTKQDLVDQYPGVSAWLPSDAEPPFEFSVDREVGQLARFQRQDTWWEKLRFRLGAKLEGWGLRLQS